MDELVIRQDTGIDEDRLVAMPGIGEGVHISVSQMVKRTIGYSRVFAYMNLSKDEAWQLYAWLDSYLNPEMPNPCPDGLDECK